MPNFSRDGQRDRKYCVCASALVALMAFGSASLSQASQSDPAASCGDAISRASLQTGVPIGALLSIMSPSHATLENWPWTIAIDGNRIWFDTEDQARFRVWKEFKNGSLTFAIGCFQLDYRQHGQAFASIEAMFDPFENAHVAAIALAQLKSHLGDWPSAIAAFRLHNRVHFPHAPVTLRIARSGDGRHHKVILDRLPQVGSKEPTQTDSRLSQRKTLTKDSLGTSNGS